MDPVALAATTLGVVTPYLVDFGKDATREFASGAGRSAWEWVKGKLTGTAGHEVVADLEYAPAEPENALAVQAALTKMLKKDPEAAAELDALLKTQGIESSKQTMTVIGHGNTSVQADRGSRVTTID